MGHRAPEPHRERGIPGNERWDGTNVWGGNADNVMEHGGVVLGYANGIGTLQQTISTADTAAPAKASATNGAAAVSSGIADGVGSAISGDRTSLSSASGLVAQALSGSDVRTDKVAALQQSIAAGTYGVSASDVASKVMDFLLN